MASTSTNPTGAFKSEGGGGGEPSEARPINNLNPDFRGLKRCKRERGCTAKERISKMPPCEAGKRSSIYRGVTRHRWTGRYEAHLWDKSTWNQNQNKKGKQVYLGAYDDEEAAARAYDLAALKYWGAGTLINFPVSDYSRDLEEMQLVSREEYLASLRRKSSGVSRVSKDRAFVRQLQCSQWDHSCGELFGNEYFNAMNFGTSEDMTENECIGSFCLDRKIDLTNCIKWWGSKKNQHFESAIKSSEETRSKSEEADRELKLLEETFQPTEPYQLPSLGLSPKGKSQKAPLSCLTVLLKSEAYKRLQNIAGKDKDQFQSKTPSYDKTLKGFPCIGGNEKPQDALDLMELSQKNPYSLTSLLQAPLMTNCISIEPLPESTFLTSLIPQTGVSLTSMSKKNESSLPDPFYSK